MLKRTVAVLSILSLMACQQPGQNVYDEKDLGRSSLVVFGRVITERPITIKRETTGAGATAGAAAGAVGGSAVGGGRGALLMLIAGAVVGGVAGHYTEQGLLNDNGIEYTIKTSNPGKEFRSIISIAQNVSKNDTPIAIGSCVMIQISGTYQRVLPQPDESLCIVVKHKKRAS